MMFELFYNNPRTVLYTKRYVVCAWVRSQQIDEVITYMNECVQLMWNTRTALWAMQQAMAQNSKSCLRLPWWHSGKESSCHTGHAGSIPGLGGFLGDRDGSPLQYTCLGNPTDRGAWWATVHGITTKSGTTQQLNNYKVILVKSQS